jgi:hypothetical protein
MSQPIRKIKLPPPSAKLIAMFKEVAESNLVPQPLAEPNLAINSTFTFASQEINRQVQLEYLQYIPNTKFRAFFGVMKNTMPGHPSSISPHTDRRRLMSLNYYIDLGGSAVETVFYTFRQNFFDARKSTQLTYLKAGKKTKSVILDQGWYAFDGDLAHSVENILTTRTILSLRIVEGDTDENSVNKYGLSDLIRDYPELIGEEI